MIGGDVKRNDHLEKKNCHFYMALGCSSMGININVCLNKMRQNEHEELISCLNLHAYAIVICSSWYEASHFVNIKAGLAVAINKGGKLIETL